MTTSNYYYIKDNVIQWKSKNMVNGIGPMSYQQWKGVKLFSIADALSATDFIVHIYSDVDNLTSSSRGFAKALRDRYGITDEYIGTIYCLLRGIDYDIKAGQFCSYGKVNDDPKNFICGYGPTILMALANLYYEMTTALNKTFIP